MKNQIMIGLAAVGLMVGCATNDKEDMDRDNGAMIEESSGAATEPDATEPKLGTKMSDLPAAVQKTIREQAPNAKIDDIDKEKRSGQVVYEIQFAEPGKNPKLHIAEDGSIVKGDEKDNE
jgi:uncharacterized membrane protein YkoI